MDTLEKRALWKAVRNKDYFAICAALKRHAHISYGCPQSFFAPMAEDDQSGRNLLHVAVGAGDRICAICLLHHGAGRWVNRSDAKGRTAVHWVVQLDDLPMWFALRYHSSYPPRAVPDAEGRTPLHYVAMHKRPSPALCGHLNAAWAVRDSHGKLAEDYADETGKTSMHIVLRELRKAHERKRHQDSQYMDMIPARPAEPIVQQPPAEVAEVATQAPVNPFAPLETLGDFRDRSAQAEDKAVNKQPQLAPPPQKRAAPPLPPPPPPPAPGSEQMEIFGS